MLRRNLRGYSRAKAAVRGEVEKILGNRDEAAVLEYMGKRRREIIYATECGLWTSFSDD